MAGFFCFMPYNRDNYKKRVQRIREVYLQVKEEDVPDTRIVRSIFPKHGIFISYRQWMNMKHMRIHRPPSSVISPNQLALFS